MRPLLNLLLLLMISTFTSGDPCKWYKGIPDIHRRDPQYELSNGEKPINDRELVEGWYGDKSFQLLDTAPGFFKCGGLFPMWMSESYEDEAAICIQDRFDNCSEKFRIQKKTCKGYEVYFLRPAPVHRTAYCFIENARAPPMFNATPSVIVDLEHEQYKSYLLFRCNVTKSSEEGLFYKTIWYVGGAPVHTFNSTLWTEDYIERTTLTEDILVGKKLKAGINIQCTVRAQYNGSAFSSSGLSENQFVGVKVHSWNVELAEGETRRLPLELTVPFGCGTGRLSDHCYFNVDVLTVKDPDDCNKAAVFPSACGIEPFAAQYWKKLSYVSVVGKVTSMYGHTSGTTHLKLITPKIIKELSEFWEAYDIGHIAVKVNKNTSAIEGKKCMIHNDPYLSQFDGRDHLEVDEGVFVLYEDETRNIEVQIETEVCRPLDRWLWPNPICTCGIAVRAGKTTFEISHCDTPVWHIGYTACEDGGDVIIVRRKGAKYQVTLPTGTIIDVNVKHGDVKFLNADVYPTPLDIGKSRGLCGVMSDNHKDDLTMRNGQVSNSGDEFMESWRISKARSLFNIVDIRTDLDFKPVYHYCTCDEPNTSHGDNHITCSAMAASEVCKNPKGMDKIKRRDCSIAKRKKRMAQPQRRRHKRATQDHSWRNGWNESAATAFCRSQFDGSVSVQLEKDVPGVDFVSALRDCVSDIKASGTTLFTAAAISSVAVQAQREAMVNPALSEPDPDNPSDPTLYDVITKQICAGECNSRGTCSDGECQCDTGYEGEDCSLDVKKPPHLVYVADDGHCDLAVKDCLQAEVLGDVFSGGKNSMCSIRKQMVLPSGERRALEMSSSKSMFESISEVFCTLPELSEDEVVVSINISVSHAGDTYSNELSVLVYDSSCVNVNHNNGTWTLQAGFCVYKGRCTPVGNLREDHPCVRCVEEEGEDPFWKQLTDNDCSDGHLVVAGNAGNSICAIPFQVTNLLILIHAILKIY